MVEDWLGYLLGLVAVFDLVFLYGLVFSFSFRNGGGSLLFGGFVDDGFGIEKNCVLMKFLGFLGVGL